jgi:hypothetical protein
VTYNQIGTGTVTDAQGRPMSVPRYERVTQLSPEQQALYTKQSQMQSNLADLGVSQSARLQGLLGTNLNTEGLEAWNRGVAPTTYDANAFATQRDQVTQALMDRYRAQSDPQRQQQEAQLASRGLSPGSSNWGSVQDAQNRQDTDQMSSAILAGGQEQSRMLGELRANWQQQQDYAGFLNNLRGAQLGERQTIRNAPINEISALMSGSQVSVPQFQPFSRQGVDSTPIGQYIAQNYANKSNAAANANSGFFGLGSAALGAIPYL